MMLLLVIISSAVLTNTYAWTASCYQYDFLSIANDVGRCVDKTHYTTSKGYTLPLGALDALNLESCIGNNDKAACDIKLASFVSISEYWKELVTSVALKPTTSCPCIERYDSEFHNCFKVMDDLKSYCVTFTHTSDGYTPQPPTEGDDYAYESENPQISSCADAIRQTCGISSQKALTFDEAVGCIINHASNLENECEAVMSTLLSSVVATCSNDLASYCPNSFNDGPLLTLICLVSNVPRMSSACRTSILSLAQQEDVPCAFESSYYCSDKTDIEDILLCLTTIDESKLSSTCKPLVDGYKKCQSKTNHHRNPGESENASEKSFSKTPCWSSNYQTPSSGNSPASSNAPKHQGFNFGIFVLVLASIVILAAIGKYAYKKYKSSQEAASAEGTTVEAVVMRSFSNYVALPNADSSHGSN